MSEYSMPAWLQPYKNDWRSASRLRQIMDLAGQPFTPWFMEVRGRLRSVCTPANNGKTATHYLVKHVWAAARAHGVAIIPTGVTEPLEGKYELLRQRAAALEAQLWAKGTEIAGLEARMRVLGDAAARAEKAVRAADLIRLSFGMTEPRSAPGVYFLLSGDSECTYVGQSKNVLVRMAGHVAKDFHTVRMVRVEDQAARLTLEAQMIDMLQPRDNVQGRRLEAA